MGQVKKHKKYNDLVDLCELQMEQDGLLDLPLKHVFTDGIYLREVFIPKGVWLTSLVHKTEHPYIVSSGVINILTEEGMVQVIAPYTGINKAGTRRIGCALEDCIFTAIFPNEDNCTDIDILENRLFEKHNNMLLTGKTNMEVIK